jgi:hypothetical protein
MLAMYIKMSYELFLILLTDVLDEAEFTSLKQILVNQESLCYIVQVCVLFSTLQLILLLVNLH